MFESAGKTDRVQIEAKGKKFPSLAQSPKAAAGVATARPQIPDEPSVKVPPEQNWVSHSSEQEAAQQKQQEEEQGRVREESEKEDENLVDANSLHPTQVIENILLNVKMRLDPFDLALPNEESTKYSSKENGRIHSYAANTNQGIIRNYNED